MSCSVHNTFSCHLLTQCVLWSTVPCSACSAVNGVMEPRSVATTVTSCCVPAYCGCLRSTRPCCATAFPTVLTIPTREPSAVSTAFSPRLSRPYRRGSPVQSVQHLVPHCPGHTDEEPSVVSTALVPDHPDKGASFNRTCIGYFSRQSILSLKLNLSNLFIL